MYIDRNLLSKYPFSGYFYTLSDNMPEDGDFLSNDSDDGKETVVEEVMCDIQETNKAFVSGALASYLDIYFPFDKNKGIEVRMGQRFKCDDWYRPVDGAVYSVTPSQMGGCVAKIKEIGVDERLKT